MSGKTGYMQLDWASIWTEYLRDFGEMYDSVTSCILCT